MTLTCAQCGKVFEKVNRGKNPSTCSPECQKRRHAETQLEARWRKRGGSTRETRTCLHCGETFEHVRTIGILGRGTSFCSDQCKTERGRIRAAAGTAAHRSRLTVDERASARRQALLARYGLTSEKFDEMTAMQGGVCAICGQEETRHHSPLLKIDHDHSCCPGTKSCGKCVRGLLCSSCNRALGLFGDSPAALRAAADYLDRFTSTTPPA